MEENNRKQGCGCRQNKEGSNQAQKIIASHVPVKVSHVPQKMNEKQEALYELIKAVQARKSKISNRFHT
jgi:Spy/CpxP family protein refolding chaperone